MDLSSSNIIDSCLTELNFYRFNQFFEKYLDKINVSNEEFNKNIKSKNKDLFISANKIRAEALKTYKEEHPNDYELELEYQTKKLKEQQEEQIKLKKEYNVIKKEEQIKMVMRQTDYDYEKSKQELEKHNFVVVNVISDYLRNDNGEKSISKNEPELQTKSTNQQIYSHIRQFLGYQKK